MKAKEEENLMLKSKSLNTIGARLSAFVVSFGTVMMTSAAMAQDLDRVVQRAGGNLSNVGDLVNIVCYGGGAVLAGTGLLNFKKHVDNPSQNELRKAVGPAAVGVALLAFPSVAGILNNSLFRGTATNAGFDSGAFQATF